MAITAGKTAKEKISRKFLPSIATIVEVIIEPDKNPDILDVYLNEYAKPFFSEISASIVSDGACLNPLAKRSSDFDINTKNTLGAQASDSLLNIVKIVPVFNIGNFRLNMSIMNPAKSFAINEKKITAPSRAPNDLLFPPNSSTMNTGKSEKIMDDAIPQQKCIPQSHKMVWFLTLSEVICKKRIVVIASIQQIIPLYFIRKLPHAVIQFSHKFVYILCTRSCVFPFFYYHNFLITPDFEATRIFGNYF